MTKNNIEKYTELQIINIFLREGLHEGMYSIYEEYFRNTTLFLQLSLTKEKYEEGRVIKEIYPLLRNIDKTV